MALLPKFLKMAEQAQPEIKLFDAVEASVKSDIEPFNEALKAAGLGNREISIVTCDNLKKRMYLRFTAGSGYVAKIAIQITTPTDVAVTTEVSLGNDESETKEHLFNETNPFTTRKLGNLMDKFIEDQMSEHDKSIFINYLAKKDISAHEELIAVAGAELARKVHGLDSFDLNQPA